MTRFEIVQIERSTHDDAIVFLSSEGDLMAFRLRRRQIESSCRRAILVKYRQRLSRRIARINAIAYGKRKILTDAFDAIDTSPRLRI